MVELKTTSESGGRKRECTSITEDSWEHIAAAAEASTASCTAKYTHSLKVTMGFARVGRASPLVAPLTEGNKVSATNRVQRESARTAARTWEKQSTCNLDSLQRKEDMDGTTGSGHCGCTDQNEMQVTINENPRQEVPLVARIA